MNAIVLFDGQCNVCDKSVQFILKRDKEGYFRFASLQSETGIKLLKQNNLPIDIDSFVLVENNKVYMKSTAALKVSKNLDGIWKLLYVFIIVPKPIRDKCYEFFAKNRYKWFGKKETCMIPTPEIRKRFL